MNLDLNTRAANARTASETADVDLVAAAQTGDHAAFAELWRRYSRRLLTTTLRITQNHEDAEDALQDSFLRAYMHLADFRGQSKFSSWMTSIAINSALMNLRRRRSRPTVSIDDDQSDLPQDYREPVSTALNAEESCIRREQLRNLSSAVMKLRRPLRSMIEIHLVQAGKVEQSASTAGISISAAKSRLMRAKNELRETMHRRGQLHEPAPETMRMAS